MLNLIGLNLPLIKKGDDIGEIIIECARNQDKEIKNKDVLVVSHKIVSKSEGRVVDMRQIHPSNFATEIARRNRRNPHHIEAILRETSRIVRMKKTHLITETKHGLICANAGIDRSNVEYTSQAVLLPVDPDKSAADIRNRINGLLKRDVAVIISDTFGRPWRLGYVNVAIGVAGMHPLKDYRGSRDMFNRYLTVTTMAVADELASAAELVMNKVDRIPVVIIRGYPYPSGEGSARELIRPPDLDMFS